MTFQPIIPNAPWMTPTVVGQMRVQSPAPVADPVPANPDFVAPWTDEVLLMSDLEIDPSYQRSIVPSFVRSIVRNFDPNRMEPIMVSLRSDGRRIVMDGQHRREALIQIQGDKARWPCRVYRGLTIPQEADLFNLQIRRKKLGAVDQFRAKLVAEDTVATAIRDTVERCGFVVSLADGQGSHVTRRAGQISAVSSLTEIHHRCGFDGLELTLSLIHRAWEGEAPEGTVLKGVALFTNNAAGKYRHDRLVATLRKYDQESWVAKARSYSQATGAKTWDGLARLIRNEYNHRLQNGRIPESVFVTD